VSGDPVPTTPTKITEVLIFRDQTALAPPRWNRRNDLMARSHHPMPSGNVIAQMRIANRAAVKKQAGRAGE